MTCSVLPEIEQLEPASVWMFSSFSMPFCAESALIIIVFAGVLLAVPHRSVLDGR